MPLNSRQLVSALGAGQGLAEIAAAAGVTYQEAHALWKQITAAKLPPANATLTAGVTARVEVIRDGYGVPHIYAGNERDVYFGLGFAMAQDRLWQMDYMRRKAYGRRAEVLGARSFEEDYMYRILGFDLVCQRNYYLMGDRWRQVVDAMADGINLAIEQSYDNLPIEFDLLGYKPERWSPIDILVGLRYQWWGLSGRLQQITTASALERELGDEVAEYTRVERDNLYIVPDGRNKGSTRAPIRPTADTLNVTDQPHGSNNWVISGLNTRSGKPLLANDPHYGYAHGHGLFYECHLDGGGHHEAGFVFIGTPGMMSGFNDRIAWGFTNNGTTIRDLYAEQIDPGDPGRYKHGSRWAPIATRTVDIALKGRTSVRKTIRYTAHGPIVNDIVPRVTDNDPPFSLRWVGFEMIEDVRCLLEMNMAQSWREWRAALRNWACSVTNFIYADVDNNIGYQLSARIPIRKVATRGIRPAWHPDHEWQGYIPFDGNPRMENPKDGIIATANQRPLNPRYRWPLYGAFAGGTRQARILEILRSKRDHDAADFRRMQYDAKGLIAQEVTPRVVEALRGSGDARLVDVADLLSSWDFTFQVQYVQPAIYTVFMQEWAASYATATFPNQPTVQGSAGPSARRALVGEEVVLDDARLDALIAESMRGALTKLRQRYGDDHRTWLWGRVHYMSWPHPIGNRGHLGELLNGPRFPSGGSDNMINNVSPMGGDSLAAGSGPTYRLVADMSNTSYAWVNNHVGTSGHPGSPHYTDTTRDWASGNYHVLHRVRALIELDAEGTTVIQPA